MDDARDTIQEFCNEVIDEVTELRFVPSKVGPHSQPIAVMEELWDVRGRLDRVEELLLETYRLKEKFKRSHAMAKSVLEQKWDESFKEVQKNPRSITGEYSSARERAVEVNLMVFGYVKAEKVQEALYSIVNETYTYVRMIHNGIDAYKQDLQAIIRVYQIESSIGGRR